MGSSATYFHNLILPQSHNNLYVAGVAGAHLVNWRREAMLGALVENLALVWPELPVP